MTSGPRGAAHAATTVTATATAARPISATIRDAAADRDPHHVSPGAARPARYSRRHVPARQRWRGGCIGERPTLARKRQAEAHTRHVSHKLSSSSSRESGTSPMTNCASGPRASRSFHHDAIAASCSSAQRRRCSLISPSSRSRARRWCHSIRRPPQPWPTPIGSAMVNTYRAMSGLDAGEREHNVVSRRRRPTRATCCRTASRTTRSLACPDTPPGGDTAGNSGNVAVSSSIDADARSHIDLWMTGPFHAIGILRHNLRSTGFGLCANPSTPTLALGWHARRDPWPRRPPASVDTHRVPRQRLDRAAVQASSPRPPTRCRCAAGRAPRSATDRHDAERRHDRRTVTLTGPNGPIQTCMLHKGNVERRHRSRRSSTATTPSSSCRATNSPTASTPRPCQSTVATSHGRSPSTANAPLAATPTRARHGDTTSTRGAVARFSPVAPFRLVDSRIGMGTHPSASPTRSPRIHVGSDPNVVAVSANFVGAGPAGDGYLTLYNCTTNRPDVSTMGYRPGEVVANQAIVPLEDGNMCVYSLTATDVVDRRQRLLPARPRERLHADHPSDSSTPATRQRRLAAGQQLVLKVAGSTPGAPADASAVALNVTAVGTRRRGLDAGLSPAVPRPVPTSRRSTTHAVRCAPNTVVVPVASNGTVCIVSSVERRCRPRPHGLLRERQRLPVPAARPGPHVRQPAPHRRPQPGDQHRLASAPVRSCDSRSPACRACPRPRRLPRSTSPPSKPVRRRTSRRIPCGTVPDTSNLNIAPAQAVAANGAMVKLRSTGELCLYTLERRRTSSSTSTASGSEHAAPRQRCSSDVGDASPIPHRVHAVARQDRRRDRAGARPPSSRDPVRACRARTDRRPTG